MPVLPFGRQYQGTQQTLAVQPVSARIYGIHSIEGGFKC
jgi:hypothetical protein